MRCTGMLRELLSLTGTQLRELEIILTSLLVYQPYPKTIRGLTNILTILEPHPHWGLGMPVGLLLHYPGAGQACQGSRNRCRAVVSATLFSQPGRAVAKQRRLGATP